MGIPCFADVLQEEEEEEEEEEKHHRLSKGWT